MSKLYAPDTYVIKKKANYLERSSCGLIAMDNVYKVYYWDEDLVTKGKRIVRFSQSSPPCVRTFCCSQYRTYRTLGHISNKSKVLTKSVRTFRWLCPLNKRKASTAVFDAETGYLGRVDIINSLECILFCQNVSLRIFDHKDRHVYNISFP